MFSVFSLIQEVLSVRASVLLSGLVASMVNGLKFVLLQLKHE